MNKIIPFEKVFFPLAGGMLVVALCCTYVPNPFAHHLIAKDALYYNPLDALGVIRHYNKGTNSYILHIK
jgi:hypothetical protein